MTARRILLTAIGIIGILLGRSLALLGLALWGLLLALGSVIALAAGLFG
jgi:hypothetical protein